MAQEQLSNINHSVSHQQGLNPGSIDWQLCILPHNKTPPATLKLAMCYYQTLGHIDLGSLSSRKKNWRKVWRSLIQLYCDNELFVIIHTTYWNKGREIGNRFVWSLWSYELLLCETFLSLIVILHGINTFIRTLKTQCQSITLSNWDPLTAVMKGVFAEE